MQTETKTDGQLKAENEELRQQLAEAREALEAIRRGDVDAVVVDRPTGPQVYTLTGADSPYRVMVEEMQEGAVTLSDDGVIVYGNKQIARLLGTTPQGLLGRPFRDFLAPASVPLFEALWQRSRTEASRGEVHVVAANGADVPAYLALRLLPADGLPQTSIVVADLTDQKRYQEIMASEVFATSVLDQAQDAIVVCDPSGQVIQANRAADRLCGVNPLLQLFDAVFPLRRAIEPGAGDARGERRDAELPLFPLASTVQFLRGIEASLVRADGRRVELLLSTGHVLDVARKLLGTIVTMTDVTERKRAEEELQKLASVVRHSSEFINIATLDGQMIFINGAGAEMVGLSAEEVEQTHILQVIPDHLQSLVTNEVLPTLKEKGFWKGELQYRNLKTGRLIDVLATTFIVKDSAYGTPLFLANTSIDITQRKRAEEALRESEARFKAIASSTPDHVLVQDRDLRYTLVVNPQLGLTEQEMLGKTDDEFLTKDDAEKLATIKRQVLETGGTIHVEMPLISRNGETQFFSGSYVPRYNAAGQIDGLIGYFKNVTDRKRADEALRKSAEELARSNRDLAQFAAAASHDLQEPLRTVCGFVQLLQKKYANRLDAEADTFIEHAVNGTKRMESLIRDLLAYSRVGTRGRELTPTDAAAALRRALDDLHQRIQETGAEITHGDLPTVRADPSQLAQLFQNLVGNALKFRSQAPPKIHVDACRDEDCWQFSVRDNGIGIDAKFREEIFEIFRRLHTHKQYDGTGVGLAICKRIVDRHSGRIWVESQPGQGATFHFTIPT
jgi:PAS domain S-box-containing protein